MRRELLFVFFAAVLLYLPTVRYGHVQDDRAIIVSNPAAHSVGAALDAFDDPYWPRESGAGLYRPVTILTFAIDWTVSGGRADWFHVVNALWHGLVTVLLVMVLVRWLPLLAAAGILGAVLAARRGWWAAAIALAALAMFSRAWCHRRCRHTDR